MQHATESKDDGSTGDQLEQLTQLFKLLADRTRLQILLLLAGGERNVSSLCGELKLPQPTVSHHLGVMRTCELIGNRRAGKQIFYTFNGRVSKAGDGTLSIATPHYSVQIAQRGRAEG